MDKLFIQADELLSDSFKLAWKVYESGYRPNYIIGVWRGGAPIGIAVQEFLDVLGVSSDHIAIRTSHYKGIDERDSQVQVYGLNYIIKQVESEDSLLIVDDVHDTGISIQKIISGILGVLDSVTDSGPPDNITPLGLRDLIFSVETSHGSITEKTFKSLILLAIS